MYSGDWSHPYRKDRWRLHFMFMVIQVERKTVMTMINPLIVKILNSFNSSFDSFPNSHCMVEFGVLVTLNNPFNLWFLHPKNVFLFIKSFQFLFDIFFNWTCLTRVKVLLCLFQVLFLQFPSCLKLPKNIFIPLLEFISHNFDFLC